MVISFLFFLLQDLLDDHVFLPVDVDGFGDVPALGDDEFDLLLCWGS